MAMDVNDQLIQAAYEYLGYGWRVVLLHERQKDGACSCSKGAECKSAGKHPRLSGWQKRPILTEDQVTEAWIEHPRSNVGILLGRASGLVDIETDSEEEEQDYARLFGGAENIPVTATYISGRGRHRLFRWRDDLPSGAVTKVGKVAVRTGNDAGAMSVFPPSVHPNGLQYRWVVPPSEGIADIPQQVLVRLWNLGGEDFTGANGDGKEPRDAEHWKKILDGVPEGQRNESMASIIGKLLVGTANLDDRAAIELLYELIAGLNQKNQPPLEDKELRQIFLSILKTEQNRRASERSQAVLHDPPEAIADSKAKAAHGMKLVRVNADPPVYELHAKQFVHAPGGFIVLTIEQIASIRQIKIEALKQAKYPLPKRFSKLWDGTAKEPGLYEQLVFNAEDKEAPSEQKRYVIVAERLRDRLAKAIVLDEDQEPDSRGKPCVMTDGAVVFGFTYVWEELQMSADKVTRLELSKLLERVGAVFFRQRKYKRLDAEALKRLADLS